MRRYKLPIYLFVYYYYPQLFYANFKIFLLYQAKALKVGFVMANNKYIVRE